MASLGALARALVTRQRKGTMYLYKVSQRRSRSNLQWPKDAHVCDSAAIRNPTPLPVGVRKIIEDARRRMGTVQMHPSFGQAGIWCGMS